MISFFVAGEPIPKGSFKAYSTPKGPVVTNDNKRTRPWQDAVAFAARQAMDGKEPFDGPVAVACWFRMTKAKSVKRSHPAVKPDIDKLLRSVMDALEGVCFTNDSRVVKVVASKLYSEIGEPGVSIEVRQLRNF